MVRLFLAGLAAVWSLPVSAFEPGSLGSHYRDFGYVQGCSDEGELPGCTLIAGGSQFVVVADGPTPPEEMAKLRALPKLAWVEFRGDILDTYDSYATFALGAIAVAAEPDPQGDLVQTIQGEWVSTDDIFSSVTVDGLIWKPVYDKADLPASVIFAGEGCADGSAEGATTLELFEIGSAEGTSLCLTVVGVDADRMELTDAASGTVMVFGRP